MQMFEFPAELYTPDTMPNGEPDQCKAMTTKNRQCKNPVFGSQIGTNSQQLVGYVEGYPAYRPMVKISRIERDKMLAGVCFIHSEFDNYTK
jgi:hypothetical protein